MMRQWPSVGFELNRSSPMAKGLVHWWPPLAAQGNTLYDLAIGGSSNGPFTGNTFLAADRSVGLALEFDGTGDYVDVGPVPAISNVAEFTIMAWMRRRSTSIEVPINWSLDNNNRVGLNFWSDANLYLVVSSGGFAAGNVAVNDTNWHLNVGRYDGNATGNAGRCRIWVDRVEQTLSFSGTIPATSPDLSAASNGLRIGRSDSFTQEANGWIGDVRIWNRALSVTEIEAFSDTAYFWSLYQPVTRVWPGVTATGVTVAPNPASAVAATVNPTTVLGSLSITPTQATAVGAIVNPTVILGNITMTPNPVSAVAGNVDPTIVLGSIGFTPSPITAVGVTVDPSVVLGSVSVTPSPVTVVGVTVDPTVIGGDVTITPAPVTAISAVVDPTLILGSLNMTPLPVAAIGVTVGPTVLGGATVATIATTITGPQATVTVTGPAGSGITVTEAPASFDVNY